MDLLQESTDLILSSAIAVVYIFDASMYPSQVPLSITLAPDTIETNNSSIQSSMVGLDVVLGVDNNEGFFDITDDFLSITAAYLDDRFRDTLFTCRLK